jgi:hypothetical protein
MRGPTKSCWIEARYFVPWQKYLASVGTRCRFPSDISNAGIVGILNSFSERGTKYMVVAALDPAEHRQAPVHLPGRAF